MSILSSSKEIQKQTSRSNFLQSVEKVLSLTNNLKGLTSTLHL